MKKILLVALTAAAMVGCSQNEEIENAGQKAEIKIGTAVSTTTRAAVTDLAKLKEAGVGFTVYAYNSGTKEMATVTSGTDMKSFMDGAKASFADPAWTLTGGPYYWPLTDKIQFFAYGNPGTATLVYGAPDASNALPTITYTVADVDAQTDFVVASAFNADKTKNASNVSLGFTHALTQVNFTIKTADAFTYKLKTLSISGVKNKGTYKFGASTSDWNAQEGTATYSHAITDVDGLEITDGTGAGTLINTAWMLMPQDFTTTGTAINLSYDIYNGTVKIGEVTADPIDLNGTTAWGQGKKMRYTLTLANEGAEITLSVPEVGAWGADVPVSKP